jgi:hypothetical protein
VIGRHGLELGGHGETVKERYSRVLYFIVYLFKKYILLGDPNPPPPRHCAASPRPRVPASLSHLVFASPFHRVSASLHSQSTRGLPTTLAVFLLTFMSPLGCGYHFAGTGGQAPGDIQSIAVEVLQNRTAESGIETTFTNALLNEFIRWKRLPVKPISKADAVLGGSIAAIRIQEFSHLSSTQTLQSRVTITLALTLKRVETDEVLWQNKNLSYYQEYVETGNALDTDTLRREAINTIAVFLAQKVHQAIFEQF